MALQLSPLKLLLAMLLACLTICCDTELQSNVLANMTTSLASAKLTQLGAVSGIISAGINGVGVSVTTNANDCFETYLEESRIASNTYATAYRACSILGLNNRLRYGEQQQSTREDVTKEVEEMCTSFRYCAEYESDLAFFQCNRNNSIKNVYILMHVYLKSSAAIVELEEKYQEAEKVMLLCFIAADENYLNSTAEAYKQLSRCLKSS